MKMYIDWTDLFVHIQNVVMKIKESDKNIDTIVTLARGGFIPARIIAEYLNIKHIYTIGINFYNNDNTINPEPIIYQTLPEDFTAKNVLIIDDIIDSGRSVLWVQGLLESKNIQFKTASVIYKTNDLNVVPDYYSLHATSIDWIVFPYEL